MYFAAKDSANISINGILLGILVRVLNGAVSISFQFIYDKVLTHIPFNRRFTDAEAFILNGGIAFTGPAGLLYLNGTVNDINDAVKIGLISLIGDYTGDMLYEKVLHSMIFPFHQRTRQPVGKGKRI